MATSPYNIASFLDVGFDISHNNTLGPDNFIHIFDPAGGSRRVCFLKITEGTSFVDPKFVTYVQAILAADPTCMLAAYHFAHHGQITAQIDHFTSTLEAATRANGFPKMLMMLDLERGANPPTEDDGLSMVDYLANANVMNPMIYCGYDFFSDKHDELSTCTHMLAGYTAQPKSAIPWRIPSATVFGFDFWQYTGDFLGPWKKDIIGGTHGMDLSVFNVGKNSEGLDAWWKTQLDMMPDLNGG